MSENQDLPQGKYLDSGIQVLIAGAGVAGLWCALECVRNGHRPTIIDFRSPKSEPDGDFFVIGPSAIRSLKHFPEARKLFDEYKHDTVLSYYRHDGTHVIGPFPSPPKIGRLFIRKQFQDLLLGEIRRQNIPLRYGAKVVDYSETDDYGVAVLENGERLKADIVVAADGVHSRSWKVILGRKDEPSPSGLSILRCSMPREVAMANPRVRAKFDRKDGHDTLEFLLGQGTHCNIVVCKEYACWLLIHKDSSDGKSSESWAAGLTGEQAHKIVVETPGWDPVFLELVKSSPNVVDWRLMWRNPQPTWTSPKGRVVQCGDSAHTFLPTSANGATQAMEDGTTLATCLRIGGSVSGIPQALKIYNKLRFERVSCAQLFGIVNRQSLQAVDLAVLAKSPDIVKTLIPGEWIGNHDAEKYAIDNFENCCSALENGTEFVNTNLPKNYTYKPWDIYELLREMAAGKKLVLEGDWT